MNIKIAGSKICVKTKITKGRVHKKIGIFFMTFAIFVNPSLGERTLNKKRENKPPSLVSFYIGSIVHFWYAKAIDNPFRFLYNTAN